MDIGTGGNLHFLQGQVWKVLLDEFDVERSMGGSRIHDEIARDAVDAAFRNKQFAVGVPCQFDRLHAGQECGGPVRKGSLFFREGERKQGQHQKACSGKWQAVYGKHPLQVSEHPWPGKSI